MLGWCVANGRIVVALTIDDNRMRNLSNLVKADPEDHMKRVIAQGDTRPMAASREAMEDLKNILAGRAAFYSKAELVIDTSRGPLEPTFERLREAVRGALALTEGA